MVKHILLPLLFVASAFGQAIRVDVPLLAVGPNVPSQGGPMPQALLLSNSTIALCTHPSSLSSCTPVTTYTDSAEDGTCPPTQPLTQNLSTVCTANTGTTGRVSFWYGGGIVDYYVTNSSGFTQGPYAVSASGVANAPASAPFLGSSGSGFIPAPYTPVNKAGDTVLGPLNFPSGTVGGTDAAPRGCVDLNANLPGGLGAACVGDGTTDDTACFLAHVQYANSNPYKATPNGINKACVRVSGGSATSPKSYLIKSSTDMCAIIGNPTATCPAYTHGMILVGDGKDVSVLIPDLSSSGLFLDFGSGSYNSVHDLTIQDVTGDATTIGVVFSEGNQTASSDNNRLYHATIRLQNGSNPQNIGALFCRTDLSGPGEDVDIVTQGTALVQGNGGGPAYANGFTSPFYPLFNSSGNCTGGDSDTHQYLGSNENYGSTNSQAIALTGADEYDMGGNVYATIGNTTTVPGVVTVGNTGTEKNYLFWNGLRIEDHGTHTGTIPASIWFTAPVRGGHIDGILTTGAGGTILGGTSAATLFGLTVNADVGGVSNAFSLFNLGSYIDSSHFLLGIADSSSPSIVMGTIAGSYDSEIKTGLLTTAQILAGITVNQRQTQACGSDGCKKTSEDWFPILVSQLPGGVFPGNTWLVGDATTASAQGQVCAGTGTIGGSGTVYAKAFWNGTSWICNGAVATSHGILTFTTPTFTALPSASFPFMTVRPSSAGTPVTGSGQYSVSAFTCSSNPTIQIMDTSTSTSLGSMTPTATGNGGFTVTGSWNANDYIAMEVTSGTCTAFQANMSLSY